MQRRLHPVLLHDGKWHPFLERLLAGSNGAEREGETMNRYRSQKHAMTRLTVMLIAFAVVSSSATASAGKVQGMGQAEGVKTLIAATLQKASAANDEARAAVDEARAIVEK